MTSRALVLGGGGPVGIGWEAGMLKGLADYGIHLAEADLIVGTSAGSAVGSQLALGVSPAQLYDEQLERVENAGPASGFTPDMEMLVEIGKRWIGGSETTEAIRAEIGAFAMKAKTHDEQEWTKSFKESLDSTEWPEKPILITAVDVSSGEFVTWDSSSGVPLPLAVAASCSVPGIVPTVAIDGRRYMDGGVRSVSNADLAEGHDRIVVIAPSGAADNPFDNSTRRQLEAEAEGLRAGGSQVEMVMPDAEALAASGPNRMDVAFLKPAAKAGLRQAGTVAERVRAVWKL